MVFLERELTYLNENLVQENFNRYRLAPPSRGNKDFHWILAVVPTHDRTLLSQS
jgi:hypothetical protein